MRRFVDLHAHSTASDGAVAPGEVIRLAERKRLAVVALTDHDTTDGLAEAAAAAGPLGVRFVPGIEVSARFTGGTLHLVGLGIDPRRRAVQGLARRLRASRDRRNPRMIEKLRALGVEISMAELRAVAGGEVLGRLHMATLLRRKGHVGSVGEAFRRYLGPGAPAFVDKERLEPAEAIDAIHDAGGLAVLAHPLQLNHGNDAQLERILRFLKRAGLDGLEVYHSDHADRQSRTYLDLARRLGLGVSGGSDFHGPDKPDARLGLPRVPLAAVEQLLAKLPA